MKTRAIVSQNRKDIVFRPVPFTPSISEEFDICCVGHNFFKIPQPLGEGYVVQDYLLDQTQLTHGGAHMVDPLQLDLTQSSGYAFHLRAACGKRFHVRLPKGVTKLDFSAFLGRQGNSYGDFFDAYTSVILFENLIGPAPVITYNYFGITHSTNNAIIFEIDGSLSANCSFTALSLSGSYPARAFDAGTKWYSPLSYADPLGPLSTGVSPTFIEFSYLTSKTADPGHFVTIS